MKYTLCMDLSATSAWLAVQITSACGLWACYLYVRVPVLQVLLMLVDQQGPWPQQCQQEPFLASAMSHLDQLPTAALLVALLAFQVRASLMVR